MDIILDDWGVDVWPVAVGVLLVSLGWVGYRRRRLVDGMFSALFGLYLLFAIEKVFFPIHVGGSYADALQGVRFATFINLIPLNFNLTEMPELVYRQIFQNILLTVPFGFGVSFVAQVRAQQILWLGPGVGLGIELIQLMISLLLGYPYRVIDVNDVLLNALGVWIGYGLFRLMAWLLIALLKRLGGGEWGVTIDLDARIHGQPTPGNRGN